MIHGGMGREERLKAQESFRHDPEVQVLLATDAAGGRPDVTAALNYCLGRSADDVTEYVEENFKLAPRIAPTISEPDTTLMGVAPAQHAGGAGAIAQWAGEGYAHHEHRQRMAGRHCCF
jgi:superfamily II DNA/RNA helicase